MGEPVRIMDLARQMIALSGRKDVEIDVVGLRPGEKLAEALVDASETLILAAPKVQEVVSSSAGRINPGHIAALETLTRTSDAETVRQALFELVAQVRGEVRTEPAVTPNLRVIQGG
jgi:O-antigen biosynthesis protein WbqV